MTLPGDIFYRNALSVLTQISTLLLLCQYLCWRSSQYLCWRSISLYGIIYIVITVSIPLLAEQQSLWYYLHCYYCVNTSAGGVVVPMVLSTLLLLCQYLCQRSISPYGIIYIVITVSIPLLAEQQSLWYYPPSSRCFDRQGLLYILLQGPEVAP